MKRRDGNGLSSLLGAGVECEGDAKVKGSLRLDGAFRGNLEVEDTLIIGAEGSFVGSARGREIVVAGRFEGDILATEIVELQKGARLDGDVLTRTFVIEPGVWFQGSCRMEFGEAEEARLSLVRSVPEGSSGARAM